MKALAALSVCIAAASLSTPALALGHSAPSATTLHYPAPSHGTPSPGAPSQHAGPHFARHGDGLGLLGAYVPEVFADPALTDAAAPYDAIPAEPLDAFAPAPRCPTPTSDSAPAPSEGPHIIYIGQMPKPPANAPKVIYGTD